MTNAFGKAMIYPVIALWKLEKPVVRKAPAGGPFVIFGEVQRRRGNEEKRIFNIMLAVMTKFRNVCAHNDRLFDFRTKDALCDMKIHERLFLPREQGRYVYGKMTCSHS